MPLFIPFLIYYCTIKKLFKIRSVFAKIGLFKIVIPLGGALQLLNEYLFY